MSEPSCIEGFERFRRSMLDDRPELTRVGVANRLVLTATHAVLAITA